ncbi:MAG: hypothetical protein LBM76_02310 [Mycoplasmataceae bacterium]|nr:hypothetical protein [Mycoplasmataceae bacterium]
MHSYKIIKSTNNPVKVGDTIIMEPAKIKSNIKGTPKKPSKFDTILQKIDLLGTKVEVLTSDMKEVKARMERVENTLQEHSDIFKHNNLK